MQTKPTHFIVVDDDAINNMMCRFSIKKHFKSPQIDTFEMPESALEMIQTSYNASECKPTVLFLDLNMPSLNGWDFLEHFAAFDAVIRDQFIIFIVSSTTDEKDVEKAEAHPLVAGFISKPMTGIAMERTFMEIKAA